MKRLVFLPIAVLVCLTLATAVSAQGHVRYAGHVWLTHTSCCGFNQAVLKVFGRNDVPFRVCAIVPEGGGKKCRNRRTGESGRPSQVQFLSTHIGTYRVFWKVEGRVVDRATYVVNPETV